MIFLVVLAVASMLMSVRSSLTITVQETLSVALYTVHIEWLKRVPLLLVLSV